MKGKSFYNNGTPQGIMHTLGTLLTNPDQVFNRAVV